MEIFRQLILIQSLVILNKCLYDKGAPNIGDFFFNFKDVSYNLSGLSTRLGLPPFNLVFMHRSFTFCAYISCFDVYSLPDHCV